MIVLGIEGTAHTVGAAILDKNRIYSSITSTFRPSEGGINPRDAADFHFNHIVDVINSSLYEFSMETRNFSPSSMLAMILSFMSLRS